MQLLITRFHALILTVTVAITGVAAFRIPGDYAFPAHWQGSQADWLWPRWVIFIAPFVQVALLAGFFILGRLLTRNHYAKSQHILDPALTLIMGVVAATQLGLLFAGMGSDLDFVRLTAYGLGATLLVIAVVLFEAERHTYAGLRMPWPVRSDAAWTIVHRLTAIAFGLAGIGLVAASWFDLGLGILVFGFAAVLVVPVLVAALASLATRNWHSG